MRANEGKRGQPSRSCAATHALRALGRDGGIGRRAGLKIQFWQQSGGSIPPPGTKLKNGGLDLGPFSILSHSAHASCVVYLSSLLSSCNGGNDGGNSAFT